MYICAHDTYACTYTAFAENNNLQRTLVLKKADRQTDRQTDRRLKGCFIDSPHVYAHIYYNTCM